MRKFVSPHNKQKVLDAPNKTFGVPLDELVLQVPADGEAAVPAPVKKICEHIYRYGVNEEGIFRMSGSTLILDKLKTSFNVFGDADLEADGDIMAVAGLLKLFLRELPDSVIPESLTKAFLAIQAGNSNNKEEYIRRLRLQLQSLSGKNHALLKYIICFLVAVSSHQDMNKMGPMALATVFGPNIFRCHELRIQGITNLIVSEFILSYNELFRDERESEPAEIWKQKMKKTPPPRPPPPQVMLNSKSPSPVLVEREFKPVPAPRTKQAPYDCLQYQDEQHDHSPHFSDEEAQSHGRASPFVLESESHSVIESPMVTARTSELVERIICDTITEKLFGSDLESSRGSPLSGKSTDSGSPDQRLEDNSSSIRARVAMFEKRNSMTDDSLQSASQSGASSSASWLVNGDLAKKGGGDTAFRLVASPFGFGWVRRRI